MNEKVELAKKALDLSDQEWQDLGEPGRDAILKLADSIKLEEPKEKEGRAAAAEGIRRVLALDSREYALLPDFATDKLLKKLDEL